MIRLDKDQVNELFEFVSEYEPMFENKYFTIDKEIFDDEEFEDFIKQFVEYKFKINQEGDHRNDGQFVDYEFLLMNPNKEVTKIWTEMCLVVGWNHGSDEEIK